MRSAASRRHRAFYPLVQGVRLTAACASIQPCPLRRPEGSDARRAAQGV